MWLSAATHILSCPSALTAHEKKTEDRWGVGGLNKEKEN